MKYFLSQIKKLFVLGTIFNGAISMEKKINEFEDKTQEFSQKFDESKKTQYKWIINDPHIDGVKKFYNNWDRPVTQRNINAKRGPHTQVLRLVPVKNNQNPIPIQQQNPRMKLNK